MNKYTITKDDGSTVECVIKSEWKDWTYMEFNNLFEIVSALPDKSKDWIKSVIDPNIKVELTNIEAIEVKYALKAILKEFSTFTDEIIVSIKDSDLYDIIGSNLMNQINAVLFAHIFANNLETFGVKMSKEFDKGNFQQAFLSRVPAPNAEIITLASAMDYEIAIQNEYQREREDVIQVMEGIFTALPHIAALYEVQPFDEEKIAAATIENENRNMQELLDFFYYTKDALRLLRADVPVFSVQKVEANQE